MDIGEPLASSFEDRTDEARLAVGAYCVRNDIDRGDHDRRD